MSHSIQSQIHAIARRARQMVVVHGLCWFLAIVVAVAFALGWVDYSLRLQDHGVRIIFSLAFALTLVWSFQRFVVPAIRRQFSELEVAQQVERCFPQLGDRLSSSLEFLRSDKVADQAESASLRETVISETEAMVRPLNLDDCLDSRATRRSLLASIPLLIAIGVVCATDLDATTLAGRRLVAPWSRESWPRWNALELVASPHRIAFGHDFTLEVKDRRDRLPNDTKLQFWFDGDEEDEVETAAMQRGDDRFHYTRRNVTRSFKYRAVGGDDDSMDWHSLEVVEPVQITDLQVTAEPPVYSGIALADLPGGPIRILQDTQLTISGRTTRPVQRVRVYIGVGDGIEEFDAAVNRHDWSFAISTLPTNTVSKGQYWIELIEADGVVSGSDTRAGWEVVPDHAPSVTVSAPSNEMYFTPTATVPIRVTATDDLAVQRLQLQIGTTTIPLFVGSAEPEPRDELPAHADVRQVSRELDLSEFQLAPHDSLELVFSANDYRPQSSDPMTRTISIISRDDFDYRSQERQKLLLQRLVEALRLHRTIRAQVGSLQTQLETVGALTDDDASLLRASELQQQQVARLLDDSPGGAAQLVAELISSLSSNQMAGSDATLRMEQLSETLDLINRKRLPNLQSELVRAIKSPRVAKPGDDDIKALLTSVGDRQDAIAIDLQSMIDQLARWDDYRRFAHDVAKLLRDQQELSARVSQLPTIGQRLDTLSAQQRADLERAAGEQLELARRFDRVQAEMNRLREEIRESDAAAAATLSEALREAGANGIAEQMRGIGNNVARNRLGNAAQAQSEVERGLQQVLGALTKSNRSNEDGSENPSAQQLAAALKQLITRLTDIKSRQEDLFEATSEWLALGSSSIAPEQMAREQKLLASDTKQAREQMPLPKVIAFGMNSVESDMNQAATRLQREDADERVSRLQGRSLSRLEQLLAALSSRTPGDDGENRESTTNAGDNSATGSPDEQPPALSLEELRLLHALQLAIYERTVALEEQREVGGTLDSEAQQEVQQLATEQGQLAKLVTEATSSDGETNRSEPTTSSPELKDDLDRALEEAGIPGFGADQ